MFRRDVLRIFLATPFGTWIRPWLAPPTVATAPVKPDAATIYRQAFGWAKNLGSDVWSRISKPATVSLDDDRIKEIVREAGPTLEAIRRAASIEQCDWGPGPTSSDDLLKDRLGIAGVNVVHLACLSARCLVVQGRHREALDDIFAALTLAHRMGEGGVLFARLLESGAMISAFNTLGRILPDLDRPLLDDLSRRLEKFPPQGPASAAIGPESRFILGSIRKKLTTMGPMLTAEDWKVIGFDEEEVRLLKRLTGGNRATLLTHLDASGPAFADLARLLDLPWPAWRPAVAEFAERNRSTWPVVASLVKSGSGGRQTVDRQHAIRTMARAGLALVRNGEQLFAEIKDPFTDGRPFGLERRCKGWVIRSALSDEVKPEVTLAIGEVN